PRIGALAGWLTIVTTTASACTEAPSRPPSSSAAIVSDSAGVRIIEHRVIPSGLPRWVLEDRRLQLGSLEGDDPRVFGNVVGVVGLGDSLIVVADAQARELRAFSTGDEHVWSFGRRGGGPAEFT